MFRPVTSLKHQGGEEISDTSPNFLKLCPIDLNYAQHYFPSSPALPLVMGLEMSYVMHRRSQGGQRGHDLQKIFGKYSHFVL